MIRRVLLPGPHGACEMQLSVEEGTWQLTVWHAELEEAILRSGKPRAHVLRGCVTAITQGEHSYLWRRGTLSSCVARPAVRVVTGQCVFAADFQIRGREDALRHRPESAAWAVDGCTTGLRAGHVDAS